METIVVNLSGKVRRESMGGRDYLVAPMTLIQPGVLNGSKGPLLYPQEEIGKDPEKWNSIPLVVYHPKKNGLAVSARTPEILNTRGVGFVFRSEANGCLKAEAWFDEEDTKRVDNRILEALDSDEPISVSTGLFTKNIPADEGATFNGQPYDFIATDYVPDHVAILPDQEGACSLEDGCGVLVNEAGKECKVHPCCNEWMVENEISHSDLHDLLNKQLQARFTQDEPHVWITDVFDTFIVFWQGDELFKLSYTRDKRRKGDSIVSLSSDDPQRVVRETSFVDVSNSKEETINMAKAELVSELVANCDCWEEKDLEGMTDDQVTKLISINKSNRETIKKATKPHESDLGTYTWNSEKEEWEFKGKEAKAPVSRQAETEPTDNEEQDEEQWLKGAPKGVRAMFERILNKADEERNGYIDAIVANEDEAQKKIMRASLENLDMEVLESLAANSKPNQDQDPQDGSFRRLTSYLGMNPAGSAPVANRRAKKKTYEPLRPLTVNDLPKAKESA